MFRRPIRSYSRRPFLELETERLNENEYDFVLELLKVDSEMPNIWRTFNLLRNHPIYVVTGEKDKRLSVTNLVIASAV
jgi:hypothetical protein